VDNTGKLLDVSSIMISEGFAERFGD